MASEHVIRWTDESIRNLEVILEYLETNWTEKEVNSFKSKLGQLLETIRKFPTIFPASQAVPRLRKAVLSAQTTVFYEIKGESINLISLFDTRQDPSKIK